MKNIVIILVSLVVLGFLGYLIGGATATKAELQLRKPKPGASPVSEKEKTEAQKIADEATATGKKSSGMYGGLIGGVLGVVLGLGLVVMLDKKQKDAAGQPGGGGL